jgi:hypothetical protein
MQSSELPTPRPELWELKYLQFHPSDIIQEQVCECQGVKALMTLIEPAQMNHGEDAMVTTAAKLLTVLQGKGT